MTYWFTFKGIQSGSFNSEDQWNKEVDRVNKLLSGSIPSKSESEHDVVVDPNQNLLSGEDLVIDFELVPTGTARNIKGKLGFKNRRYK